MYMLTTEETDSIVRFINGEDASAFDTGLIERWMSITNDINKAVVKYNKSLLRRTATLSERLSRIESRQTDRLNAMIAVGSFDCFGIDSIDVCKAIIFYFHKHFPGNMLTWLKTQYLAYHCYAVILEKCHKRLTIEHPQAAGGKDGKALGPVYWKTRDKIDTSMRLTGTCLKPIGDIDPKLVAIIENVVSKYGSYAESALKDFYCNSLPLNNADKEKNNGKWNKDIDDKDIYLWKQSVK